MKNTYYILLFLICLSVTVNGQITKSDLQFLQTQIPKETVQLDVNSKTLLSGEFLYFKVYTLNPKNRTFSSISKIAYVELIARGKNKIFKQKLLVNNSTANGEYFIPSTLKTGHYKLIAYTNWSKNNLKNSFTQQDIYIINPYISADKAVLDLPEKNIVEIKKGKELNRTEITQDGLAIKTNKTSYRTREKVAVNIENVLVNFNEASVSVKKIDSIQAFCNLPEQVDSIIEPSSYYSPELRGEIISGKLVSKTQASVVNKTVSLSVLGENFIFKNAKTNQEGYFFFNINEYYKKTQAVVQVQETNPEDYKLVFEPSEFNQLESLIFNQLHLDTSIKNWLKQYSINNQIDNAYYSIKTDSVITKDYEALFYHPNSTVYKLDDYNRFKTIKETFIEIIYASSLKSKGDNYEFVVNDYDNSYISTHIPSTQPLVLVDGLLITNNNDIVYYDSRNIDKIAVVAGYYMYGSKIYNGIISFKTKNNDFSLTHVSRKGDYIHKIDLLKPQESKIYYTPDYTNTSLDRIPDFRNQLFWEPNLKLPNQNTQFEFYTSDNLGSYEIVIEGYTTTGQRIKTTHYFEVR